MSKDEVFLSTIYTFVYDFKYPGSAGYSGRQGAVGIYQELLKKI